MMISLIIPAYNEEKRIEKTIRAYREVLANEGLEFEIIVEMDGCTDRTSEIVQSLANEFPEIVPLEFKKRLGKGGGLIEGFKVARGDIVGFADADEAVPAKEFVKLLNTLLTKDIDGVIASRRVDGAIVLKQPLIRRIARFCFNTLVRCLFRLPFRDTQCGAKIFRREVVESVLPHLRIKNFAFDVELLYLAKKMGYRIKEVGVKWTNVDGSKVTVKAVIEILIAILELRLRRLMPLDRGLFKDLALTSKAPRLRSMWGVKRPKA